MKYVRLSLWIFMPAVVVAVVSCKQELEVQHRVNEGPKVAQESGAEEEPLLLLEDTKELPPPTGTVADNSRCHVCHINYADEELAVVHARAIVGCEQCHGSSDTHCSDEDNITPPDIMYFEARIKSFCIGCHTTDKIDIPVHKSVDLADTNTQEGICTHCHGEHRLSYRTRKWDKSTGKLIEDDKVHMLTDELLEQK